MSANRRQKNTSRGRNKGAGYNGSWGLTNSGTGGGRKIGADIDIGTHHSQATGWWIANIVLLILIGIGIIAVLVVCIVAATRHHHSQHNDWKEDDTCVDSNQCTYDVSRKITGQLVCDHFDFPKDTPCESVCYQGNNHRCTPTEEECDDCMECRGDTCMGYCESDNDCPDIDFSKGFIWTLANIISNGAFGFEKFCYRNMCIYEHDSAVLPLTDAHVIGCTSEPAALAFATNLETDDPLTSCLVPTVICRGQFDDQVRVDSILLTFACSNASLPLFQFSGNTP